MYIWSDTGREGERERAGERESGRAGGRKRRCLCMIGVYGIKMPSLMTPLFLMTIPLPYFLTSFPSLSLSHTHTHTHAHTHTHTHTHRYLKYLTKKFLKKNNLRDYIRVVANTKTSYELCYFQINTGEDDESGEED